MANLGKYTITATEKGWTNLTTLANIGETVVIQNTKNACKVCDHATIPQDEGFIIPEGTLFEYTPGTILWVQPYGTKNYVDINVSS